MQRFVISFACILTAAGLLFAADVSGKWTASFDTQIGVQNYTYDFKVDGEKLTGTAKSQNGESPILEGKVIGDQISFAENLDFQGQQIHITYAGTISGDEIKLHRKVGEFAEEDLVAKRAK
jgi:hypothetical protein